MSVLSATLSIPMNELAEYRYQPSKYQLSIYAIGQEYFCVSKAKPREPLDLNWEPYLDQFFAKRKSTIVWVAIAEGE